MDAAINRFVFLLKRRGARISPAESLDAMRALARVALHERDTVRAALRCTLIKNLRDLPPSEVMKMAHAVSFESDALAPAASLA